MKKLFVLALSLTILSGCNFNKSVKIDLISGLTTKGDLISCENVTISVEKKSVTRTSFTYGENFTLEFNDVKGLKTENGKVFPGMELYVTDSSGDTVLAEKDLYSSYSDGISLSPLVLTATVTAARPIHSGGDYSLFTRMWDKKDKGTFTATLKFKVVANEKISIEKSAGVSYQEVYLFTKNSDKVINNNEVKLNEQTYLLFEGLSGFTEADGKIFPGISINATAQDGQKLLDYKDLFADYSATGVDAAQFKSQVMSNFVFESAEIKTPIHLVVTIWDKKSDAKIKGSADLTLK